MLDRLRPYVRRDGRAAVMLACGRGLHSFTFQLNLSRV